MKMNCENCIQKCIKNLHLQLLVNVSVITRLSPLALWLRMKIFIGKNWKNGTLCCILRKQHLCLDFVKQGFVSSGIFIR